jgi:uncharacterized protein DUF4160
MSPHAHRVSKRSVSIFHLRWRWRRAAARPRRTDDCEAKFWLDPIRLERSHGFPAKEINRLAELFEQHESELLEKWNEFFGG